MATLFPKKGKRARAAEAASIAAEAAAAAESAAAEAGISVFAQFERVDGEKVGPTVDLPVSVTGRDMDLVLNELSSGASEQKYEFFVDGIQITGKLSAVLSKLQLESESVVTIQFQPQSIHRIAAVTRCTSSLPGHTDAITCAQFSPDCLQLATGSGDACVRLWDMNTETPRIVCKGHTNWVLSVSWSPDGSTVASGSKDNTVRLWNAATGELKGKALKSHTAFITCICWQPIHIGADKAQLVSSSKDSTLKRVTFMQVWNADTSSLLRTLSGHSSSVTCVRWTGNNFLVSSSQDKTMKTGIMVRSLDMHGHWINSIALSSDHVMRNSPPTEAEAKLSPAQRYAKATGGVEERMVSCSDDHTLCLWLPCSSKKPVARMTGHMQPVNHVAFSPDGSMIASASFDKSVKIWDGRTGKFLGSCFGHVGAVYQVAWSSDSRLLVSASKDSTVKVWDAKTRKLAMDLPGHADEVFAVDWAADGSKVATGGKDCALKLWRS